MYLQLGEVPVVVISSPIIAKEVLRTHDRAFVDRPKLTSTKILFYNCKDIKFTQYGDYWRQMRRICIIELLSAKMVKSFSAIREDELSNVISSIRSMREQLSGKYADRNEFITIVKGVLSLIGGFDVADLFPSWKLLHNITGVKSRLMSAQKKVDVVMQQILNEHIENKAAGKKANGEFGDKDLIDVLLRVKENVELQFPVINDHIKAVLLDIFLAGTETSSATIIWALAEMIKNPNVLAKAQSEVRQVFKGKKKYEEEDLEKLTYLNLVVKEALRLHPPAPLIGPRECREQADISGYTIPLKTRVLINAWALARDLGCWDDPESFIPERFENSPIDFTGNHFEFIPFGAGRRMCPGMSFGLANVTHPLAQLLLHFKWELPDGTNPKDLDMTETYGITATKKKDLLLVAKDHSSDDVF
ncbi:Cytochrome 71D7 [Capsicum annuum]|nr:Cytochrome 71D7 [Capsicum annuum]KAF3633531.1 Cytochrome 71D7 [Capsicum annuum]